MKLSVVLGAHMLLCMTARFFFFLICPKNWENWEKIGFFKLTENLVINFSEFGV